VKRIFLALAIVMGIYLLSGCAMVDAYNMYSKSKEVSVAKEEKTEETTEKVKEEVTGKVKKEIAASEVPQAVNSQPPAKLKENEKEQPAAAVQNTEAPSPSPKAANGPFTIDETYFNILDVTYADMVNAFGEAKIYSSMELGIYSYFEEARVFCGFEMSDIERFYEDEYNFIIGDGEFDFTDEYADRSYVGETFAPEEFEVCYIEIYAEGINAFFGYDELILLSEVNKQFGWEEDEEIYFNDMYEIYESSVKEYGKDGEYGLYFNLMELDGDYVINSVNIWQWQ